MSIGSSKTLILMVVLFSLVSFQFQMGTLLAEYKRVKRKAHKIFFEIYCITKHLGFIVPYNENTLLITGKN